MELNKNAQKPRIYLLPAIHHSSTPVLKPPESLPERAFDFSFHSIDLIASNPFLPLQFRITQTPAP